jgi:hypothetical protein
MKGKKRKKMSKDVKKVLIGSIALIVIIVVGGTIFYVKSTSKIKREANEVNLEMQDRLNNASRSVYRAINDIKQGQIITEDLVECDSDSLSDDPYETFITAEDLGKEATIDIVAGQAITTNMVTSSLSENWSETELDCIYLSSNLEQYDWVDVRILYPNGTDYIVMSKKCLRKVDLSVNNVFFWLNEDELLSMDSAIVDANLNGAKIYTTKYMKPAIQEAHTVTYQPTEDIIELIKSDPNVVTESARKLSKDARAAMEEKLESFKNDYTDKKNSDELSGYDFNLDTTTNAGSDDQSDNNHGTESTTDGDEGEYADDEDAGLETSRNTDSSNETTLQEDEDNLTN